MAQTSITAQMPAQQVPPELAALVNDARDAAAGGACSGPQPRSA